MRPVEALELALVLIPVERVSVPADREDVEVGTVAMPFLVRAHRHLRHVRVHRAVGKHEHDVAAARATLFPGLELEGPQVRNEVRLPHVPPRTHWEERALALVVARIAQALREVVTVVPDELVVAED